MITMGLYRVSGNGPPDLKPAELIAEAVKFKSGKIAISFLPDIAGVRSVIVYDSLDDAEAIHVRKGRTWFTAWC